MQTKTQQPKPSCNRQQGMVLVGVMMFLFVMTALSLGSTRTASIENRIAVNAQMKDVTFSGAEMAMGLMVEPKRLGINLEKERQNVAAQTPTTITPDMIADYAREDGLGNTLLEVRKLEHNPNNVVDLSGSISRPLNVADQTQCVPTVEVKGASVGSQSRGNVFYVMSFSAIPNSSRSIHRQEVVDIHSGGSNEAYFRPCS